MILDQSNFVINLIEISNDKSISSQDITNEIKGFTSNNSSPVMGQDNMKYKIMFSNLKLKENTEYLVFQICIKKENNFYNPYMFDTMKIDNINSSIDFPGRALSFSLFDKKFDFLWFYLTRDYVNDIIERFSPMEKLIDPLEYINEYFHSGETV